jgi:hypothetical protein
MMGRREACGSGLRDGCSHPSELGFASGDRSSR